MNKHKITLIMALVGVSLTSPLSAAKAKDGGFSSIDKNNDGSLTLGEYTSAVIKRENARWKADGLSDEQIQEAKKQVKAMSKQSFDSLDMNGDGEVTESEIAAYHKAKQSGGATAQAPKAAKPAPAAQSASYDFPAKTPGFLKKRYKDHDVNQDGFLTLAEFTTYLGVWLKDAQPDTDPTTYAPGPFKQKDTNGDGLLSPQETMAQYNK